MTPEIQKFIELLESQLGYAERQSGYTKFGDWYGRNVEFDADYSAAPWCEMYLSWAAKKLGYEEWMGQFAWTVAHAKWFKEQGAWGKTPKPGAFVYYDWSGSNSIDRIDHVGIVTRVEGDTIHTIEGNIDGGVAKRKERDTSKVVGYGYPERIKARMDEDAAREAAEAKKKAEEQSSVPPGPGTDVGVLDMRQEPLSALIPKSEGDEAGAVPPMAVRPEPAPKVADKTGQTTAKKTDHTTGAAPSSAPSPASSSVPTATSSAGAAGRTGTMGKHAKPTTADTTSATAEPLPTHIDASAGSPLPSLDSPTLIGSALVAALALLAVAKTRQNRLRPAAAGAAAARPARSRPAHRGRRRRRGPAAPADTPAWTRHVLDTVGPVTGPIPVIREPVAGLVPTTNAEPADELVTTANADLITTANADLITTANADLVTAANGRLDAAARLTAPAGTDPAAGGERRDHQVRRLLDSRPFDPFADAPAGPARFDRSTAAYGFASDVAPAVPSSAGGALVVDTGPFQQVVIPGATSAFDAFAAPGRPFVDGDVLDSPARATATYRGRRRRQEQRAEEWFTDFEPDLAPRGRRHRELIGASRSGRGRHRS